MSDTQTRRETRLPLARTALTPRSYDAEAHTVELVAATGFPVRRYDYNADCFYQEVLEISAEAIDASRIDKGVCPLLNAHSSWRIEDQLGTVSAWRVEQGGLVLTVRFGSSDAARAVEAEVAAGNVRGVSVGYGRQEMLKESRSDGKLPTYTVKRWSLSEVSLVPVPADPDAGVRADDDLHPCTIHETRDSTDAIGAPAPAEEDDMNTRTRLLGGAAAALLQAPNDAPGGAGAEVQERAAPATPAAPAAPATPPADTRAAPVDAHAVRLDGVALLDFADQARAFGVEDAQVRTWATTLTPDAARAALLQAASERQRADAPITPGQRSSGRVLEEDRDKKRTAMANALEHRFNPSTALTDGGREYRGMSLLEMARDNLERNGFRTRGMGKRELAAAAFGRHGDGSRMHSTSDFPNVLSNVAGKTLRDGYEASPQTFKTWQRRASAPDFKQIARLQLGGAPSFLLVPEGGQFKQGTLAEGKEVYSLATYGRIFAVTRQTLINDDLDAFTRIPTMWGRAAADFESDAAYVPLIANPNMGDGIALFHASHGNLAGSGAAISEATIQAGEIAMGSQNGLEGRPIRATPKFLITAVKDKVPAQKLLTAVVATATSGVNVYAGSMTPIVEPRLNRLSGATPWFMAADPAQVDTIEYAYLEGDDGVFLEERTGFEVDGIEFKARLDFASKAIDWRGLYQNPGT